MPSSKHETIGSDILAVLNTMKFPENILGAERVAQLRALDPQAWYPIDTLLGVLRAVDQKSGHASLMQVGRQLFRDSHQKRLLPELTSARDVIYGIDAMYHHANRGDGIGGWEVVEFAPGRAVLKKTTPHPCWLEEGILHEALHLVGADALIVQSSCVSAGAPHCLLELRSAVRDQRWTGAATR